MAIKMQKQGEAKVAVQHADGAETTKAELVGKPVVFDSPPCQIGLEMSYTHNLGGYKSARAQVSIVVPCTHAELDEVFDFAKAWVEGKMEVLVQELQANG